MIIFNMIFNRALFVQEIKKQHEKEVENTSL